MLLRNEERIEAPEAGFHERRRRHLSEAGEISISRVGRKIIACGIPHLEENIPDFFANLQQWMQGTTVGRDTVGLEVILLVGGGLPRSPGIRPFKRSLGRVRVRLTM